jgi:Fe-S-cluster containining protein
VYGLGIDCTTCANGCRGLQPTFSEEDVGRVARRLGMDRQQFINTYLQRTEQVESNPWKLAQPCPFLKGNLCSVYENRPGDCSEELLSGRPKTLTETSFKVAFQARARQALRVVLVVNCFQAGVID